MVYYNINHYVSKLPLQTKYIPLGQLFQRNDLPLIFYQIVNKNRNSKTQESIANLLDSESKANNVEYHKLQNEQFQN